MTITVVSSNGPAPDAGYNVRPCETPQTALNVVGKVNWPQKWRDDIRQGRSPMLGTDPVTTLNNEFNKYGYWFLDYFEADMLAWPWEKMAQCLREHFEGEDGLTTHWQHAVEVDFAAIERKTIESAARDKTFPRIAITNMRDEGQTLYFDSMNELGEWVRSKAGDKGGDKLTSVITKLNNINDQLVVLGWEFNAMVTPQHWALRAVHHFAGQADSWETELLEGLTEYITGEDKDAIVLRDLFISSLNYNRGK